VAGPLDQTAGRVLAAPDGPGGRLVVATGAAAGRRPHQRGDRRPDGPKLARPGLCSINCVYGPGQFCNLGPRRSDLDGLPGQHMDTNTPRLIMQHGAVLLQVLSPREATVPHREVRGLSFG
jgi:hypothetical protein